MTRKIIDDCIKLIEDIINLDVDKLLLKHNNPEDFKCGEWPYLRFKELLYKMLTQLQTECTNGNMEFFPEVEYFMEGRYSDYSRFSLYDTLNTLKNSITQNHADNAAKKLSDLILFQIRYGFWDRSSVKIYHIDEERLSILQRQLDTTHKTLQENLRQHEELKQQYKTSLTQLREQLASSRETLSGLKAAETDINNTLTKTKVAENEVENTRKNAADKLKEINAEFNNYKTNLNDLTADATNKIKESDIKLADISKIIDAISDEFDDIYSQKARIYELVGLAADGALGNKFESRKRDLNKLSSIWLALTFITALATIGWIIIVFAYLKADTRSPYMNFAVNLLKTFPGIFLLGFVINQYSKERNIQEEYAFKSAIAMTLTAYTGMLNNDEDKESRRNMLIKSIEQVYTQPKIHNPKADYMFSFRTKDLKEVVIELLKEVKDLKDAATKTTK